MKYITVILPTIFKGEVNTQMYGIFIYICHKRIVLNLWVSLGITRHILRLMIGIEQKYPPQN